MKFRTIARAAALACGLTAGGVALALTPPIQAAGTIGGSASAFTFAEFAGGAGSEPVGIGRVDSDTLFFIDEKQKDGIKSWYVFFDPACKGTVDAEITFSSAITGFITTRSELESTTATYGKYGVDYEFVKHTGLERKDYIKQLDEHTLHIHWKAGDPGDHVRVWTTAYAVPEPQTYAMLMAGLILVAGMAKRQAGSPSPALAKS